MEVYAVNREALDEALDLAKEMTAVVGMTMGLDKCARVHGRY